MKNSFFVFSLFLLASCASYKQTNFNRQKFTELKSQKTNTVNTDIATIQQETPTHLTNINYNSYSQSDSTLTDYHAPKQKTFESLPYSELGSPEEVTPKFSVEKKMFDETEKVNLPKIDTSKVDGKIVIGNRRDFEKLTQHDKNQSVLNFNRMFNAGLTLFLIALLFLIGGLLFFPIALVAIPLIFSLWILSFVALNKVRRIDLSNQSKRLRTKIRLAQLVCGIGVAVCIVTLLGGVVLLVLWLARII